MEYEHVLDNPEFDIVKDVVREMLQDGNDDLSTAYTIQYVEIPERWMGDW